MKTRLFCIFLSVVMVLSLCSTAAFAASDTDAEESPCGFPFADVPEDQWYYRWVKGAHQMGLIDGKTADTFCPDDNMTYAEAAKLAACMNQRYHEGAVTLTDAADGSPWYESYYQYCLEHWIMDTSESNGFNFRPYYMYHENPNAFITREECVYLFCHALPLEAFPEINETPNPNNPERGIPDVMILPKHSAWEEIYHFYRAGIVNGCDAMGSFHSTSYIKRSEVAAILNRMMDPSVRVGPPAALQI